MAAAGHVQRPVVVAVARGKIVRRLLAVADSRFQPRLVPQAQTHGKLPASYVLPERYSQHLLAALDAKLLPIGGLRQSFHPGDDGKHTF